MIPFIMAFALVQVCAWVWGTYETAQGNVFADADIWRGFLVPMVLVPVACAWIGAEVAAIVRPFDTRKRTALMHIVRWCVCGLVAGGVTIAVEGVALTINAERLSDYVVMSVCPLVVACAAVALFPRASAKSGCPSCGYDWTGLSKCPECGGGRDVSAAAANGTTT